MKSKLKLNNDDVIEWYLTIGGENKMKTARHFNVSARTIGRIVKKHLDVPVDVPDVEEFVVEQSSTPTNENMHYVGFVTYNNITITRVDLAGVIEPETVSVHIKNTEPESSRDRIRFTESCELWKKGDHRGAFDRLSFKEIVKTYAARGIFVGEHDVFYQAGNIRVDFPERLRERLYEHMVVGGTEFDTLVNFAIKLAHNPSKSSIDQLFDFIEGVGLEISATGEVYAYKAIRTDWMDCYTGTIDNSIGKSPEMPRSGVCEDPNITCAPGLHVCAPSYLNCYGESNHRFVKVSFDPANFVSCPTDYKRAKARVCKYTVLQEVKYSDLKARMHKSGV